MIRHSNTYNCTSTQSGYTLVEMLLALLLVGSFMTILATIFASSMQLQTENQAVSTVMQDGRYIMSRLNYDIHRATAVTTPAALGGSGSTLAITIGGVSNSYTLAAGKLRITNGSGTTDLNGNQTTVTAFNVQRIGNTGGRDTIRLSVTVTSTALTNAGTKSQTFTTTVGRR